MKLHALSSSSNNDTPLSPTARARLPSENVLHSPCHYIDKRAMVKREKRQHWLTDTRKSTRDRELMVGDGGRETDRIGEAGGSRDKRERATLLGEATIIFSLRDHSSERKSEKASEKRPNEIESGERRFDIEENDR